MNKDEKLKDLKNRLFLIQMTDRWSDEDCEMARRLQNEIRELERKEK